MDGLVTLAKIEVAALVQKSCSLDQYNMLQLYSVSSVVGSLPHRIRRHFYRAVHRNTLEYNYFMQLSGESAAELLSSADCWDASVGRLLYLSLSLYLTLYLSIYISLTLSLSLSIYIFISLSLSKYILIY